MKTYTAIKAFTIKPQNISVGISDTLVKYDDSVAVIVGNQNLTSITFYHWVGSTSSSEFMTLTSEASDTDNPYVISTINTESFGTMDIVNTLNSVVNRINGE